MVGFWRYKIIGDLSFNDKTLAKMQKHLLKFGSITNHKNKIFILTHNTVNVFISVKLTTGINFYY